MRYLSEQELAALFDVQGVFYNQNGMQCRRFLDIKRKNVNIDKNDLSVVMMNPGNSSPKNIDEKTCTDYLNKFVEANPDKTQFQIMRVMENCGFNYAKIINLSDVRCTSSDEFYKMHGDDQRNIEYSIFSESNKHHIKTYLNPQSLFIYAWGVDTKLQCLAEQALRVLNSNEFWGEKINNTGIPHPDRDYSYYHPLPKNNDEQIEWVKKITEKTSALKL